GDQDRAVMQQEYDEAYEDIQNLSRTEYNGRRILEGTTFTIATGVESGQTETIVTPHATHPAVTIIEVLGSSVSSQEDAGDALIRIDNANDWLQGRLGILGADMNTLQSAMNTSQNQRTSLSASESRIRDVDIALESAALARSTILQQGAVALLAQANASSSNVLQLLQP
ncbi:MAG: flagellin, partial [Planctomycetota bacterium]